MPQQPPVSFRDARIERELDARARPGVSRGAVANREVERYYALIGRELGRLPFSEAEASAICDALNGTILEPSSIPLLRGGIEDAVEGDDLATKWGIDGGALVSKLRELPLGALYALADAVERFWLDPNPLPEALRRVGLIRD